MFLILFESNACIFYEKIHFPLSGFNPAFRKAPRRDGVSQVKPKSTQTKMKRRRPSITIGFKIITLIAGLLLISVGCLVWVSSDRFTKDTTDLIQQMNMDRAAGISSETREIFEFTTEKMRILGSVLLNSQDPNTPKNSNAIPEFFSKDKNFLSLYLFELNTTTGVKLLTKALAPEFNASYSTELTTILASVTEIAQESQFLIKNGGIQITTLKFPDTATALALVIPLVELNGNFTHFLVGLLHQNKFTKVFGESDLATSFMVDSKGKLLAHPDIARVEAEENISSLPIVKKMLVATAVNGQTTYFDSQTNETKLGAFQLVGFGGLGIITEVPEAKAHEPVRKVINLSIFLALTTLSIAFSAGYFFSGMLTWPIKQLVLAAHRISQGDFKINLKPKGRDEIAELSLAFNEMAKGLEERDRVKETFNKFHNREIADKLLSGDVKLGGENKEAVIFFSDIRGFTALSEMMEPEQVVEMLNEYMTSMVAVIRSHGGIVDKYVGDAIMALWGIPIGNANDVHQAVKACLGMRLELAKLNEKRKSRGQPVLKIGMGLNLGRVIAGNIGSDEKMEYTVIGDSVNLASRIESMTKEYGTDLLISKTVYERVQSAYLFESCASAMVKGKTAAIEVFKVKGYINTQGQSVMIETPYSSYSAEKSDKTLHINPFSSEPQTGSKPQILKPPPPFKKPGSKAA